MYKKQNNIPASYLILRKQNQILLLRRFNTGYEDGNYSFIAGNVESGESFSQCIIREAKEEAGIILNEQDLEVVHIMHRNSGLRTNFERIEVFFQTDKWEGKIINKEQEKCDDLSWFNLKDLPENVIPYIKEALLHIQNNKRYSEYGWK